MKRIFALCTTLMLALVASGCSALDQLPQLGENKPLHIVAATELQDLEPLIQQAGEELGTDIEVTYLGGTLENSQALKSGELDGAYDATWFATNRYANLIGAADALGEEYPLASSPIAIGLRSEIARSNGWVDNPPTWEDLAQAAKDGEFTFGMTDPTASNSGFSTVVSAATALADTGVALTQQDLDAVGPQLAEFFSAQTLSSGSSGWLADTFRADPSKADGIFNYESTLHQLKKDGLDLEVIVPADGTITADYPLSTLRTPQHEGSADTVRELAEWFEEHQQEVAETYRRPVFPVDALPAELSDQNPIDLQYPANEAVARTLLERYNDDFRRPGQSIFLLDTSGSMQGERMDSLKAIMGQLIGGSAATSTGDVSFRNRESVSLRPFNSELLDGVTATLSEDDPESRATLSGFIDGLEADGYTATYGALKGVLEQQAELRRNEEAGEFRAPTIVLLSDGEATVPPFYDEFAAEYAQHDEWAGIPVFVILYGEAKRAEMDKLAELTGGKVFDAQQAELAEMFKEIRGYQ